MVKGNYKRKPLTTGTGSNKKSKKGFAALTQAQKEHIESFGEMHPAAEESSLGLSQLDEKIQDRTRLVLSETDLVQAETRSHLNDEADVSDGEDPLMVGVRQSMQSSYQTLIGMLARTSSAPKKVMKENQSDENLEVTEESGDEDERSSIMDEENKLTPLDPIVNDIDENSSEDEDSIDEVLDIDNKDPFKIHFDETATESITALSDSFQQPENWTLSTLNSKDWFDNDNGVLTHHYLQSTGTIRHINPQNERVFEFVKNRLLESWKKLQGKDNPSDSFPMSPLQLQFWSYISQYKDFIFTERNMSNSSEMSQVYLLHALNHVFKTRDTILKHNERLRSSEVAEFRDQGFTRPKVLIIVPVKSAAFRVVQTLIDLSGTNLSAENSKRFHSEFGPTTNDRDMSKKPADFAALFDGNSDDCFRIGIKLTRKTVKLYAPFYSSDILVASPLGLRLATGVEGDKHYDSDFLSSIELVVLDHADVYMMQNWQHVSQIFRDLNGQPKSAHDCDFSRVRNWCLDGRGRYVRQSIILSSFPMPEINSLVKRSCLNISGRIICSQQLKKGVIKRDSRTQIFERVGNVQTMKQTIDARFHYFISSIVPKWRNIAHTVIIVPDYFDYVRIRKWIKKHSDDLGEKCPPPQTSFICEYTNSSKVIRARGEFYHGRTPWLLCTERWHFYNRLQLRGVHQCIWYSPPLYVHFYDEFRRMASQGKTESMTNSNETGAASLDEVLENVAVDHNAPICVTLYTRFDEMRLSRLLGSNRCAQLLASRNDVATF